MHDRRPRLRGGRHRPRPKHRFADGTLAPWNRVRRSALRRRPHRGPRHDFQRGGPDPGQLDRVLRCHVHGRRQSAARNAEHQLAARRPSAWGSLTSFLTRDRRWMPASTLHPPLALELPACRRHPPVPYPGVLLGEPVGGKGGGGGFVRGRGGHAARERGGQGKRNREARAAPMAVLGGNESLPQTCLELRGRAPAAPRAT